MTSPHADLTRRHKDRTNKHNYLDIYHHNNLSLVPNVLNIRCKFYLSRDNMGRFKQKHILPSNWKKNIAAYQIHTSGEAAELIRFKHLQKKSKYKLSKLAHVAIQCEWPFPFCNRIRTFSEYSTALTSCFLHISVCPCKMHIRHS